VDEFVEKRKMFSCYR